MGFKEGLTPHLDRTRAACRQAGEYLMIEDTTLLDCSDHPATQDLGRSGNGRGRGFELHRAVAGRVKDWTLAQRTGANGLTLQTVSRIFMSRCNSVSSLGSI